MKKAIVIGIVCLFMMMIIPSTTGDDIEYPIENGPYFVYLCGQADAYGYSQVKFHFGPLWWIEYPRALVINTKPGCRMIINGEILAFDDDYVVELDGFKGFGPGFLFDIKPAIFRTRAIGICDAIILDQK